MIDDESKLRSIHQMMVSRGQSAQQATDKINALIQALPNDEKPTSRYWGRRMNILEMRKRLMARFPSGTIRGRKISNMSDNQILAIYRRLVNSKTI